MIKEILAFNKEFVEKKQYTDYITTKYPNKKLAILSCMDTRLIQLLPASLGLKNGDAKIIKNAGGVISHPYGSAVRSLLIAIYELGVNEIMIIGHSDCGVQHLDNTKIITKMKDRGIDLEAFDIVSKEGIDIEQWLGGFEDACQAIRASVDCLKNHPLIPKDVLIQGFMMDSITGKLDIV